MSEEKPAGEGGESGGGSEAPRKELEGFEVIRTAPPASAEGNPLLVPIIVVVLLAIGGGLAATQLGGEADPPPATTGGGDTSGPQPTDEEVPDYVWDRLDFLEGEGNIEKALEVAEEANGLTPNSRLRDKINGYRKELGLHLEDLSLEQALLGSRSALSIGNFQEALDMASVAIERSEGGNAEAFYLRGAASGRLGQKAGALEDLETALELGYEPAGQAEALIKQYEQ